MNRTAKTLAATATGALALGLGVGVAGPASADPTTSPAPNASSSASAPAGAPADGDRRGPGRGDRGDREDGLAAQLAEKLGLEQAEVRTALQDYREANRPTSRPDPGTARTADDTALAAALAEALDVDQAEVTAALTEIRAARQAERAEAVAGRLADAVQAGTLTRAEADAVQKAADAGIVHVGRG